MNQNTDGERRYGPTHGLGFMGCSKNTTLRLNRFAYGSENNENIKLFNLRSCI